MIRRTAAKGEETFIAAVIYGLWVFNGLLYTPADFFRERRICILLHDYGAEKKNGPSALLPVTRSSKLSPI